MTPNRYIKGRIEASDFDFGSSVMDILYEVTTRKAEALLEEAMGQHCGDGPLCDFVLDDNGRVFLDLKFWLCPDFKTDSQPFVFQYALDDLLEGTLRYSSIAAAVCKSLKLLIKEYEDQK